MATSQTSRPVEAPHRCAAVPNISGRLTVISQPLSAADFKNHEIAPIIERYMRWGSMDARSRSALVRLLWDFLGTECGIRHALVGRSRRSAHRQHRRRRGI